MACRTLASRFSRGVIPAKRVVPTRKSIRQPRFWFRVISSVASTPTSASMDETEHSAAGPDASEPTPRTLRSTRGCGGPAMDPLTERCRVETRLDVSVPRPGQRPALALDGGNWHVPM